MHRKDRISESRTDGVSLYRKIDLRLLPLLFIGFLFAYLDRVNVGFAKLQMQSDLGFSDAAYGIGAGIFFVGYVLFEVPSNLLLPRVGARLTFSRIMVLWGITSMCMVFVNSIPVFYALRFLLGVFEAGFAPGVLFYLSRWYGPTRIAGAISMVWLAGPFSGIVGGPLSAWIMTAFAGTGNLAGWQWMFLIEGAPTLVLGIAAYFLLADDPSNAKWLNEAEKRMLAAETTAPVDRRHQSFLTVLRDPKVYVLAAAYLCIIAPIYALSFWLPTIIKSTGVTSTQALGWYAAIPYVAAAFAIFFGGRSSDKRRERRHHIAVPALISCLCFIGFYFADSNFAVTLACMAVATGMMWMANIVFWAVPAEYIKGDAQAGAIALINTIGLSGGFFGPSIIGWSKSMTGSVYPGFLLMAAMLLACAVIFLLLRLRPRTDATLVKEPTIAAGMYRAK